MFTVDRSYVVHRYVADRSNLLVFYLSKKGPHLDDWQGLSCSCEQKIRSCYLYWIKSFVDLTRLRFFQFLSFAGLMCKRVLLNPKWVVHMITTSCVQGYCDLAIVDCPDLSLFCHQACLQNLGLIITWDHCLY